MILLKEIHAMCQTYEICPHYEVSMATKILHSVWYIIFLYENQDLDKYAHVYLYVQVRYSKTR